MKRVMETTDISVIKNEIDPNNESDLEVHEEHLMVPEGVEVYEINGPYFFGIATKFEEIMSELGDRPKVRIIRMRKVPFIDSTGIHNLTNLCEMSKKENIHIVLSPRCPASANRRPGLRPWFAMPHASRAGAMRRRISQRADVVNVLEAFGEIA